MIAKNAGNVSDSGSLKIVVNGAFGKLNAALGVLHYASSGKYTLSLVRAVGFNR
jgi:hypothetical protein